MPLYASLFAPHALNQRSPAKGKGQKQVFGQHALKGQKLLAQGSTLGINDTQTNAL